MILGYVKHESFDFYYNKKIALSDLKGRLEQASSALFDLDGTIYPGLLIADVAFEFLKNCDGLDAESKTRKLNELRQLAMQFSSGADFYGASMAFAGILRGLPYGEFRERIPKRVANCFPNAVKFIRALKVHKKCYLASLTARDIAKEVTKYCGMDGFWSMDFKREATNETEVFQGGYVEAVKNTGAFKKKCLASFGVNAGEYMMAGNSMDDFPLLELAAVKIGVKPKGEVLERMEFDVILAGDGDPWQGFANWVERG